MSWLEWIASGGPLAIESANRSINDAEKRGADEGVITTLRKTLAQCEADHDAESAWAIDAYAARLGAGGAYTNKTTADVFVEQGLDAAKKVKETAIDIETVVIVAVVVAVVVSIGRT